MQVLVTGGAGFIGGHLAENFVREGHNVTILDSLHPYYDLGIKHHTIEACRDATDSGDGRYEFVKGDVRNAELVDELVTPADYIFHHAARAGVRDSVKEPREYNSVNVGGTLNILDSARDSDTNRVVVASSSSVYGKPQYLPYDEQHPTTPVSPYGASKLAQERYAASYTEVYGLPTVSLRYFTVYGPRMRPNMAISNFVSRCLDGKPPVVYGDGTQTRDFTYITDVVEPNRALMYTDAADGEVLNIGSTDNIEIRELAEEIRDQLAPEVGLAFDERHPADAEHTHANTSKAADLIDYNPTYTIREGIGSFIEWYRANREWYEPLVRRS